MRALLMAGFVAAVAGSAAADVVGNIEFGTEFTDPGKSADSGFSSLDFQVFQYGSCGGGHCESVVSINRSDSLDVAINRSPNGFPMFLEGESLGTGTVGTTFPLLRLIFGPRDSERRVHEDVPLETSFFLAFQDEEGRDGFVQAEFYSYSDGFNYAESYRLLGWAIELEPSDDPFVTFDVRNGIPAPTSAGLLGLAGIAATRRRR